jgi:dTDP-4-dehydrorhamnose reductase
MIRLDDTFHALIVGASGFVGRRLQQTLGPKACTPSYLQRSIPGGIRYDARTERLKDVLAANPRRYSHVFVLYGAIDMDGCARDPEGTARVNIDSVRRMIDDTISYGALPVYASTDYIFDGKRGNWTEGDDAHPVMEYGRQKLAIETFLRHLDAPWITARFSKVVSGERDTHSMLGQWVNDIIAARTMRCASDQVFSPAYVGDVAELLVKLAISGERGLFNLAGPAAYSRLDLLQLLVSKIREVDQKITPTIVPASLHDMPFLEKRPLNTSLDISKLRQAIPHTFKTMPDLCTEIARENF